MSVDGEKRDSRNEQSRAVKPKLDRAGLDAYLMMIQPKRLSVLGWAYEVFGNERGDAGLCACGVGEGEDFSGKGRFIEVVPTP